MLINLLSYSILSDFEVQKQHKQIPKHLHDFFEIYLFLSGNASYIIEEKSYEMKPFRLLFIKPYTYHFPLFTGNAEYKRIIMHFKAQDDGGLVERLFNKFEMVELENYPELMSIFNLFIKSASVLNRDFTYQMAQTCLIQFLIMAESVIGKVKVSSSDNPLITKAIKYINQNIERRISLGELSDSLFIDKSYLSKLFKQHFNMPVVSYIRNKQLLLADTMIKNGTPPTEVYLKCGFSDYSSFYRAYVKMFNRSPSKNKK